MVHWALCLTGSGQSEGRASTYRDLHNLSCKTSHLSIDFVVDSYFFMEWKGRFTFSIDHLGVLVDAKTKGKRSVNYNRQICEEQCCLLKADNVVNLLTLPPPLPLLFAVAPATATSVHTIVVGGHGRMLLLRAQVPKATMLQVGCIRQIYSFCLKQKAEHFTIASCFYVV